MPKQTIVNLKIIALVNNEGDPNLVKVKTYLHNIPRYLTQDAVELILEQALPEVADKTQ